MSSGGFQPRKDACYWCRHLILLGWCSFFKKMIDQGLPAYWNNAPVSAFSTLETVWFCSWKGLNLQEQFSHMNYIAQFVQILHYWFKIKAYSAISITEEKHRAVIWKNINTFTRWHRWAVCFCEHWEQFNFGSISRGCEQWARGSRSLKIQKVHFTVGYCCLATSCR